MAVFLNQVMTVMMKFKLYLMASVLLVFSMNTIHGQWHPNECNATVTSGNEIPCGDANFPCCDVYNACNGSVTACHNYDPDFSSTGGCDLSCTPIDSGVLFLLLGGAAFGGMMIMRRRQEALEVIKH